LLGVAPPHRPIPPEITAKKPQFSTLNARLRWLPRRLSACGGGYLLAISAKTVKFTGK
jgi:hypothetical protein